MFLKNTPTPELKLSLANVKQWKGIGVNAALKET